MKNSAFILVVISFVCCLCGCYNRYTGNFEQFPEITNLPTGVVDQAGLTDEDKRRQLEFLKQLDAQKEPVYRINAGDKISIRVYSHPDLIMESLVTPDGAIGVMFAGQVQVAGLTLEEGAAAKIPSAKNAPTAARNAMNDNAVTTCPKSFESARIATTVSCLMKLSPP